jgi:hypothetical protein
MLVCKDKWFNVVSHKLINTWMLCLYMQSHYRIPMPSLLHHIESKLSSPCLHQVQLCDMSIIIDESHKKSMSIFAVEQSFHTSEYIRSKTWELLLEFTYELLVSFSNSHPWHKFLCANIFIVGWRKSAYLLINQKQLILHTHPRSSRSYSIHRSCKCCVYLLSIYVQQSNFPISVPSILPVPLS